MRARRDPDRPPRREARDGGFTLLESLVALSVAAILAVGLIRFAAGTQVVSAHADRRLAAAMLEASIFATLPPAKDLVAFSRSGSRSGLDWSLSATPIAQETQETRAAPAASADPSAQQQQASTAPSIWQRYTITLSISDRGNILDRVETVRLGKAVGGGET